MTTGTYLTIVAIGAVMTVIVGVILIRAGHGFLRDVFDDDDVATSTTNLLGVLFFLVALGFLGLISTYQPVETNNPVEQIITQLGGMLLVLGILHGATLLLLARLRNRRRSQALESEMSAQYEQQRRSRQTQRQQVIEGGSSGTAR